VFWVFPFLKVIQQQLINCNFKSARHFLHLHDNTVQYTITNAVILIDTNNVDSQTAMKCHRLFVLFDSVTILVRGTSRTHLIDLVASGNLSCTCSAAIMIQKNAIDSANNASMIKTTAPPNQDILCRNLSLTFIHSISGRKQKGRLNYCLFLNSFGPVLSLFVEHQCCLVLQLS
jgi:hypothetical protein